MPWRETLLMDQRVQFIADYQRDVFDVADAGAAIRHQSEDGLQVDRSV